MTETITIDAPAPRARTGRQRSADLIPPAKRVTARVTKKGSGLISTGEHVAGEGDITHEMDAVIELDEGPALLLEDRGWIEIR